MHLVHKILWTLWPFSITIVFCRLGLKVRLVARWENERLCPKVVLFPQFAHLAILRTSFLAIIPSETSSTKSIAFWKARHFTIYRNLIQGRMLICMPQLASYECE